jgi:GT2 family glycosyltransferase
MPISLRSQRPATPPHVFVNVLTWNRVDAVVSCLLSLNALTYESYSLLVIDNHSEDGTVERLRALFPDLTVLVNERNLGYTGGHNVGIRYALEHGADFILFLNNDIAVHPHLIENLLAVALSDPRIAVVGAKNMAYGSQHLIWAAWAQLTYGPLLTRVHGRNRVDGPRYRQVRDVDQVIGNGYMWRREALADVGLLDTDYFGYHEDVDWCYRAQARGWRVVYAGDAIVYHRGGLSADPTYGKSMPVMYFLGRNGLLFARKHNGFWRMLQVSVNALRGSLQRLVQAPCRQRLQAEKQFWRGFWDAMHGRNSQLDFRN